MYKHYDTRGSLFSIKQIPFEIREVLVVKNNANVVRGLHKSPYKKRVYVLKGSIYDFSIDLKTHERKEVTLHIGDYVDIPEGWAHGYYSANESEILYLLESSFDKNIQQNTITYWNDPLLPFQHSFVNPNLIMSPADRDAPYSQNFDFFVLGARGYLGSALVSILKHQNYTVFESNERLSNLKTIEEQIQKSSAKYVVCAAGISGKPTTEWCETHEEETYKTNFLGMLDIARICDSLGKYLVIFGSGGVYSGSKSEYSEEDAPDNKKKVYSKWRVLLEEALQPYKNLLYLRIHYPMTLDTHPKCFLSKMLLRKDSIHNVRISTTIVPSLFPTISQLCEKQVKGIFNFVNTGEITLPELMSVYAKKQQEEVSSFTTINGPLHGYSLSTQKLQQYICVESTKGALERYL